MKRAAAILAAIVLSIAAMAQNYTIDGLIDAVNSKRVRLDFTFAEQGSNFALPGTLVINGQRYKMSMMGVTTICDGSTTWVKNNFSKEVTIQVAQPIPPLKSLAKNVQDFKCENGKVSGVFVWGKQAFNVSAYNIAISEAKADDSTFTLDENSLPEEWIVTDTRE